MILEAFAQYLKTADDKIPASNVLARWLWERLSVPPESIVDQVLHVEVSIFQAKSASRSKVHYTENAGKQLYVFKGNSQTGSILLKSLYEYCLSYEQQKWARWVHSVKASDFKYG